MAVPFNIVRVDAVPATPVVNTMYITKDSKNRAVVTFIGNTVAQRASTLSPTDVQTMISEALAGAGEVYVANTLADLQAITPTVNAVGYIRTAAAGDPLMYVFDLPGAAWKVSQVPAKWADIIGRPAATAAEIDAAVAASHSHANMAVLNSLSQSTGGKLAYKGQEVSEVGFASDW